MREQSLELILREISTLFQIAHLRMFLRFLSMPLEIKYENFKTPTNQKSSKMRWLTGLSTHSGLFPQCQPCQLYIYNLPNLESPPNLIIPLSHTQTSFPQCGFPPFLPSLLTDWQTPTVYNKHPSRVQTPSFVCTSDTALITRSSSFPPRMTLIWRNLPEFLVKRSPFPQVLSQTRRPCTDGKNGDLDHGNNNSDDDDDDARCVNDDDSYDDDDDNDDDN